MLRSILRVASLVVPLAAVRAQPQDPVHSTPPPDAAVGEPTPVGTPGPIEPALLDDSIPLPRRPEELARDSGDVVLSAASGDPFVLGFVAGAYAPPADESIDPELAVSLQSHYDDGRPQQETYAFAMFSKRITSARIAELEALGCRTLGFHPHYAMKLALPPSAAEAVAALDFVRWIGRARSWQKVHPYLNEVFAKAPAGELVDVWIDVFDSDMCADSSVEHLGLASVVDRGLVVGTSSPGEGEGERWTSNGWQQHALEQLGVDVLEYVDRIRAFRARIAPSQLEALVALDFVQFVEADVPAALNHDESMPMASLDNPRATYDGAYNTIVPVGVIDSGLDIGHSALNHLFVVGWDTTAENDPWFDSCGHGSHVSGTIVGLPDASAAGLTGAAPGSSTLIARRFRSVKRFSGNGCNPSGASSATLYSYMRNVYVDGFGIASPPPFVVNNSWGSDPGAVPWSGTESSARTLDDEVYDHDQLYVFSAGNAGTAASSMGLPACAKNALTVGNVTDFFSVFDGDPGSIHSASSRGPCGDGRWKPNVTAPGRWIRSVDAGTVNGFVDKTGTSMSAPHATGLAAQLFDHFSTAFPFEPVRVASVMMASAMTFEDFSIVGPSTDPAHHLNVYGAGRINGSRAHYSSGGAWSNYVYTLGSGVSTHGDFDVTSGCTRLVIVMAYYEEAASAGASQALVNDLDLWIDGPQNGIDPQDNTGEYFAHQSARDNTEIRYINNPPVGAWRWKIWPESTTSTTKIGLTVYMTHGDTTPSGTLSLLADRTFAKPNQDVSITAEVSSNTYVASSVFLDSSSSGDTLQAASSVLADGIVTDLIDNEHAGRDIEVGSIDPGEPREATWVTRWASEGVKNWQVEARSDNWIDQSDSLQITVDGTLPNQVSNLHSTTHSPNVWSNQTAITYAWTAATDNLSGIDGYGIVTAPIVTGPAPVKDIEEVTSHAEVLAGEGSWYFTIRSVDHSGNWDDAWVSTGPYPIDLTAPTAPTNLASTTHTIGVQSCATNVSVSWTPATDALSGVASYRGLWNTSAIYDPVGGAVIAGNATSYASDIGSSASPRYFHLRAVDTAGNFGPTAHFGPIYANSAAVIIYCTGKVNSLGCTPSIGSNGAQPSIGGGAFAVTCTNALNNKNGFLYWGFASSNAPYQGGIKCVAAPTLRTQVQSSGGSPGGSDCSGTYSFAFATSYLNANNLSPGDELYAQWWMRDPQSPSTTGLSNGLRFTLCE